MNPMSEYIREARKGETQQKMWVAQFIDDFRREKDLSAISNSPKMEDTCSKLFEAVAHQLCVELGLSPPEWMLDLTPLSKPLFVSQLTESRFLALMESPYLFRARNIFVTKNYLSRA